MPPVEVLDAIRRRPFVPYRIMLLDGMSFEVRHPEQVIVGLASLTVGIPHDLHQPFYARTEIVALSAVSRLVPLDVPATAAN